MENLKLTVEELCLIGSALEDEETLEEIRCTLNLKSGLNQLARERHERVGKIRSLIKRLYTYLRDELQEDN